MKAQSNSKLENEDKFRNEGAQLVYGGQSIPNVVPHLLIILYVIDTNKVKPSNYKIFKSMRSKLTAKMSTNDTPKVTFRNQDFTVYVNLIMIKYSLKASYQSTLKVT